MMEMGIAALEADTDVKYIAIVSRKPGDAVLKNLLSWISACKKPVVALLMGCDRETVEATGAIWAENLDDCGQKCLQLIGKDYPLPTLEDLEPLAEEAAKKLAPRQKYLTTAPPSPNGPYSLGRSATETPSWITARRSSPWAAPIPSST